MTDLVAAVAEIESLADLLACIDRRIVVRRQYRYGYRYTFTQISGRHSSGYS